MTLEIFWVPSPKYTAGHPAKLRAIVHHRMVGTLKGTDVTFTTGARIASTNFGVGYGCGKTGHPDGVHVHQYVRLGDQAWGNGNWDKSGQWDDRYPTALLNSQTVSIEHHDNGGLSSGDPRKGIVPETVIEASIELDKLLLSGDLAAMKTAGISFRGTGSTFAAELAALKPGPDTIIDHHYIAGKLKPYCWRPWAGDDKGFPQARYLGALVPPPDTSTEEPVAIKTYTKPRAVAVPTGSILYPTPALVPGDPDSIIVDPGRDMPYIGSIEDGRVSLVGYVPDTNPGATTDVYYIERAKLPAPVPYAPRAYAVSVSIGGKKASGGTVVLP